MPTHKPAPVFYDDRLAPNGYGMNGHVNLSFSGPTLTTVYVDLNGNALFQEEWEVDGNGTLGRISHRRLVNDPDFHA